MDLKRLEENESQMSKHKADAPKVYILLKKQSPVWNILQVNLLPASHFKLFFFNKIIIHQSVKQYDFYLKWLSKLLIWLFLSNINVPRRNRCVLNGYHFDMRNLYKVIKAAILRMTATYIGTSYPSAILKA